MSEQANNTTSTNAAPVTAPVFSSASQPFFFASPAKDAPKYTDDNVPEEIKNKFPTLRQKVAGATTTTTTTTAAEFKPTFTSFTPAVQAPVAASAATTTTTTTTTTDAQQFVYKPQAAFYQSKLPDAPVYTQETVPEEIRKKFPWLSNFGKNEKVEPPKPVFKVISVTPI
jgi:tellurite resistance-related uncharacterized protein